ncbi:SIS domain-containing protein [Fodinibius salsisoli]|uniref:SIS domain-containing protein n=1 Tax=Fodinibius salsisoli TaxID=2820877 RepID=A0ABT3PQ30_9BACT|nr:SIS domain-containing protein [Fodinibius salsisoli]MCW9707973.1 SIS domain-containing protein [Fodinibius salsisoli]
MSLLLNAFDSKEKNIDLFTSSEIERQPSTWKKVWKKLQNEAGELLTFLNPLRANPELNIALTGAGSSAFIGDTVSSAWVKDFGCPVHAIPTTDLVTHFKSRIATSKPLLLISFARSGNSPESTAAVDKANQYCDEVYHLIITCNPDGALAQMETKDNTHVFLLPPEAEDQSLAMTNSFTSMALAATLIPKIVTDNTASLARQVDLLSEYGEEVINEFSTMLYEAAQTDFNRIIFLGSGPNWGIAKESHLKVQELTNGNVVGKFDSFLGFRHGPKAIINDETLLVYLLSNNEATNRYEKDLIEQVAQHDVDLTTLAITESDCLDSQIDFCLNLAQEGNIREDFWAILCTLPAQIIGLYKCLLLGYSPDNPSPDGTISRVVEGVTIYDNSEPLAQ